MLSDSVVEQVTRDANPLIERVARLGFAAKGLVAVMIGALALRVALGRGGNLTGPEGALEQFLHQPFGLFVLGFLVVGLWAHALWKLMQAFLDVDRKGNRFIAMMERTSFGVTGLAYAALGLAAFQLLLGNRFETVGSPDELAATILAPHLGRWVVAFIGGLVLLAGVLQLRLAAVAGFRPILELDSASRAARNLVVSLGRIGYAALGVMSLVIGYFLLRVATLYDPNQAGGWEDALGFVAGLGESRWPLGLLAAGLLCYGVYFMLQVEYRRLSG